MALESIVLVDRDARIVDAWRETFRDLPRITVVRGDYFADDADAIVAPGNSFGIMDGGLDQAIATELGAGLERRVRERIEAVHHGEIHVGCAEVIATEHPRWPWLVFAPTLRVPDDVSRTTNAYIAFRAILLAVRAHDVAHPSSPIRTLRCPGLCTGVGAMPPRRSAAQMRIAYRQMAGLARAPSFATIHETHRLMRTVD